MRNTATRFPELPATPGPDAAGRSLVERASERPRSRRPGGHAREVARIVEATYQVVRRTGSLDPTVREILEECGLSNQAFYRYFRSKDELLVALLDDGRRRLVGYLRHRMAVATTPPDRVAAWVRGVLAQSRHPEVAERTRPFLANIDRLAERYPEEQEATVTMLRDLLVEALEGRVPGHDARADARSIYLLSVGAMHQHLRDRTAPDDEEIERLVAFCLAGCGLAAAGGPGSLR